MLGVVSTQLVNAQTYTYKTLHKFTGLGNDGIVPQALLQDAAGNLYGTTAAGGNTDGGTVFRIDKKTGKERVLYSFDRWGSSASPNSGLVMDSAGYIYGVTRSGTIYKVKSTGGGFTSLYSVGNLPLTGLIQDSKGNLYGATYNGGTCGGNGTLYKLDTTGKLTVLYSFGCNPDEGTQIVGLARDSRGNFYASSYTGGPSQYLYNCVQDNALPSFGCGTIEKIDTNGKGTVLHAFTGVDGDGGSPAGSVAIDAAGNLYGTTSLGGTGTCQPSYSSTPGCGTVFKINTAGNYSVVYSFPGSGGRGASPVGGLTMDQAGNFYGVAALGGNGGNGGDGLIFKLTPADKVTVFYKFKGGAHGSNPDATLFLDSSGNFFGSTSAGGDSACECGVVFELSSTGAR